MKISGLLEALRRRHQFVERETMIRKYKAIKFSNVELIFAILMFGFVGSTIVLIFEIIYFHLNLLSREFIESRTH